LINNYLKVLLLYILYTLSLRGCTDKCLGHQIWCDGHPTLLPLDQSVEIPSASRPGSHLTPYFGKSISR